MATAWSTCSPTASLSGSRPWTPRLARQSAAADPADGASAQHHLRDFSALPAIRSAPKATGEAIGAALDEQGREVTTGDGGTPAPSPAPAPTPMPSATRAPAGGSAAPGTTPPAVPRLRKTQVSAPTTTNNGGFSWPVRWSIENATSSTNGWIVQLVSVGHSVADSSGAAVSPGSGSYGGLRLAWYPLWEAWQVRAGQVFIGGSTSPHNADTYGQGAVGASTRGATAVLGWAEFYPSLTLPSAFTVRNAAPAWALPVTNTNPGLTGGSGELRHDLIASWNGVSGNGATTVETR